jgi:hypothetical protein
MNYIIYPVKIDSAEGRSVIGMMPDRLLYPTFVFANNTRDQESFTSSSVIDKIEGTVSFDILRDAMIKNIEMKEVRSKKPSIKAADLIKQQKEELENLERIERNMKRDEEQKIKKLESDKIKIKKEVIMLLYRKRNVIEYSKRRNNN